MPLAHHSPLTTEEQALLDPLHYAMASRDADVLTLVREALGAGRRARALGVSTDCHSGAAGKSGIL